ncbi:MAG: restriction endonuclease subunit S [Schwartzia succinivorans]|uniref:restriction endonuclease subunit S n=1 Tax=Schwartzia succinivorans TaxID=55507 RepID=UPI0023520255|nr:restriction endonuclease subunit S [Schwartzia succinivorans]MBE6097623.1 restriction endonuclease subunit S [Schwartzia succinivorans]
MRAMKNSGVDWIEKIPQKWRTSKLKYSGNFSKGLNITKAALVEEGIPVISYGQVHAKTNTGTGINESLIRYVPQDYHDTNKTSSVHLGDFIFADTSEDYEGIGNCVYVDQESEIFAGYHSIIFRPTCIEYPKYMAYQFLTNCWRQQVRQKASGVKVFSVTQSILKSAEFLRPSAKEQQSIADYLDKKCAAINSITTDIQHQIEILQKYKQSVITEAVTKGLDKNVEMKDSGVEWLDKVPLNWEINKLKYVGTFSKGLNITKANLVEEGIPVISYGQVHAKTNTGTGINESLIRYVPQDYHDTNKTSSVHLGDFIFADTSEDYEGIGNCVYVDQESEIFAGYHSIIFRPTCIEYPKYMAYQFLTNCWRQQIRQKASGVKVFSLTQSILKNAELLCPTPATQQAIADYLDTKCAKIDALIADKQKQLDTLAEYKKSLIYEYVTGKKEVPVDE